MTHKKVVKAYSRGLIRLQVSVEGLSKRNPQ